MAEKEIKKITEEELKTVNENNAKLGKILQDIGLYEAEKHALLHVLAGVNKDIQDSKKELEEKYGSINVNLEDGSYTEIEEETTKDK
tara:strand:- start:1507 stop:1767 length:261 start_codon:yes stop_codon:yes gene_type:complete